MAHSVVLHLLSRAGGVWWLALFLVKVIPLHQSGDARWENG